MTESRAFVESFALAPTASGELDGLRFAVKDLIDIGGHKTSCGNFSWRDTHPAAASNAVCVDQLLSSGAQFVGKTVTDELAFSLLGENHFYGTPLNPKAPDRVPGGSSSGSASAVACGLADFALGTDTGGSVRVPASNCGIFGIRPTHGIVSVAGVNPLAPTFDTVGILAKDAEVLAKAAAVLLACRVPERLEVDRVHLLHDAFVISDVETTDALVPLTDALRELFPGRVVSTSLQEMVGDYGGEPFQEWYETYCTLQWAEIRSCLGSWIEDANPDLGPRTRMNFELTRNLDRREIAPAHQRREELSERMNSFLGPGALLCMPTAPAVAPLKGSLGIDRRKCRYHSRALSLTSVAGIARLPQVSVPSAHVSRAPVGMSLLAGRGMDGFLLAAVRFLAAEKAVLASQR
ncbi:MAG: amidase [Desulfomonilaceae bacterium]|nr:amidase [Desulfomonilaceae bacterium]